MINTDRMIAHFLKLVQIDSHSRKEGKVALQLKSDLEALGAEVVFDDAAETVGGEIGNLIARIPGNSKDHAPLLLSAHMDTVMPGEGIKPIVEGRIIKSDGTTILGGDDKSGIAIIIEVLRVICEEKAEHGEIEVVLTICEEDGLVGAKHLDYEKLHARNGLVLDCDRVDFLFTKSPASDRMEFIIHGLEAHSGLAPEAGISAIQIASEAISRMRLGCIDSETTANIGLIEGGSAVNIIPKTVRVKGESRSRDEEKLVAQTEHMRDCFREAAAKYFVEVNGKRTSGRIEEKIWRDYNRMNLSDATPIVKAIMRAAKRLSVRVQTEATGGGCDANIFNEKGIAVANLGTGMHAIHTVREWVHIDEMTQSAQMVLEVVKDPP